MQEGGLLCYIWRYAHTGERVSECKQKCPEKKVDICTVTEKTAQNSSTTEILMPVGPDFFSFLDSFQWRLSGCIKQSRRLPIYLGEFIYLCSCLRFHAICKTVGLNEERQPPPSDLLRKPRGCDWFILELNLVCLFSALWTTTKIPGDDRKVMLASNAILAPHF